MTRIVARVGLQALALVLALLTVLPLLWMVSASFMPAGEASAVPPRFLPSAPTLEHYRALFARLHLGRALWASVVIAATTTAVSLMLCSMAGYAFAKLAFRGRAQTLRALMAGLVVPAQVGMLPLFLLVRALGLVDTWTAVVIPGMASIFGIYLVRQYMLGLPDSILDAARIDGAGELRVYWSLVLRLSAPILVTLAVLTFMGTWNDFMWPLVVLADDRRYTMPVALAQLAGEHVQDTELMMAGAVLVVLPVIVLFAVLQRAYLAGITAGGVKE